MTGGANFVYRMPGGATVVRPKSGANVVLQGTRGVLQRYWRNFTGPAAPTQNER